MSEAWFPLSAFNAESGRIWLRDRKDGGDHVIRLIESDRQMMAARAKRAKAAGLDTVWFRENREGELVAIPPATFQTAMKRAYTRAGITNARAVHDWRHHAATAFVRATGDLRAAQHLLGHSQIAMTGRYAHPEERAVTDALEAMAAAATTHKITHSEGESEGAGDDGEPGKG
jgi:site-specific recombinase XerD